MAWRIDEVVIRGEIDNRVRGRVTGRLWLLGRAEPVELDFAGNAWRDIAGRRLEFTNPEPRPQPVDRLAPRQTGVIGDCTASRKVKVPDIPLDQIGEYYAAKKAWTWHWGNSLYFEWFSPSNGRVVIESASYQLRVSTDSTWEMTALEEEAQRRASADALGGGASPADSATWGSFTEEELEPPDERPLTEEEAEKMQEESERLVDRIEARMQREGEDADFEQILEEELEKRREERGEGPPTPEEQAQRERWIEQINHAAAESAAQLDGELAHARRRRHPLIGRIQELALRLMREPETSGWLPEDASEEHPLMDLGLATAKAGAKVAGALGGESWPPPVELCANRIVSLKRARSYLDDALRAAEACQQQELAGGPWTLAAQRELQAVAEECEGLIAELRRRLKQGGGGAQE